MRPQEPHFFSPSRILTFALVIFLTICIGYALYDQGNPIIFTYTDVYYAFGALILLFGVLKCLFHLARVEFKSLLHTVFATSIYLGVVFMGNFICDSISKYYDSERYEAKVYQKKIQKISKKISKNPYNETLFIERGRLYNERGETRKAKQDFDQASKIEWLNSQTKVNQNE